MENSMSRFITGSVVKRTLKDIKDNPERSIRNLVDMALQFSGGRFQQDFFTTAQTMLQNENSAYYRLVRDIVSHADTDRLYTFGMNLGYNGCTAGAQRIRENKKNWSAISRGQLPSRWTQSILRKKKSSIKLQYKPVKNLVFMCGCSFA